MRLVSFAITVLAGLAASGGAQAPLPQRAVVVELFTSQGCSSCPPADVYAAELAQQPDIVLITRPVTYWDRLGWKDTLARPENTALQQNYAKRGGDGAGVYTPQTMVQGRYGAVGSDRALVARQIVKARRDVSAAIALRPGIFAIAGNGAPAEVRLVGLGSSRVVRIGRGENSGRTIRYANVIVGERVIGRWTGGAQTFPLPDTGIAGADRLAIIVQAPNSGPILAARYL